MSDLPPGCDADVKSPIEFSAARADWFPEVPCHRGMRALVLGSGWGQTALLLAQRIDEVHSVAAEARQVRFQGRRREHDAARNLFVVHADLNVLPFRAGSFDVVVIDDASNGIGPDSQHRNPGLMTAPLLKHVAELLKPGGCLYAAGPSRAAMRGHRKLLAHAGFSECRTSWVMPAHDNPCQSARFESGHALGFWARQKGRRSTGSGLKGSVVRAATRCRMQRLIMPHVSFVAVVPGARHPSLLEGVCTRLQQDGISVHASEALRCTPTNRSMSARSRIQYVLFDSATRRPAIAMKVPRTRAAADALLQEARAVSTIALRRPGLMERRGARYLDLEGYPVLCERFFSGRGFKSCLRSERAYGDVIDWLAELQGLVSAEAPVLSLLSAAGDAVDRLDAHGGIGRKVTDYFKRWLRIVEERGDRRIPSVPMHGDLTTDNVLVSADEVFVTDWEWAAPDGAPWEDFWMFLMSCALNTSPDGSTGRRGPENLLASLEGRSVHSTFVRSAAGRFLCRSPVAAEIIGGGLLPALAGRVVRDIEEHRKAVHESTYLQFTSMAADAAVPLWDCAAQLLAPGGRGPTPHSEVGTASTALTNTATN